MIRKHFKRLLFSLLTSAMVLLSILFVVARLSSASAEGGIPGGNISDPVVRAVDVAKPAIVRIFTTIGGHVTVHITATQSATFPLNGGNYKLEFSGSGAFITAHGDILTADHVVNPPHDSGLDEALYEMAAQDVADYVNNNFNVTTPYTAQDTLSLMADGNFRTETHYGQPSSDVYLSTDYTGPLVQTNFKNLGSDVWQPVTKIEQQSPTDEHDMAIIHVNMSDTPGIQLGDSSGVEQLDELTIIGFPGNGDINDKNDPTQLLTSSVNKIYVSALKENDMSSPLIQVSGNVEHGDSGGPALDSNGNIVGVVSSFSSMADDPLGTSFLQASNSAQTLILIQGLDTTPGPFEKAWRQAFADYASTAPGHWHKAQQELQKLSSQYNSFNAVTPYLNYAQNQAMHEQLPTPASSSTNYAPWVIGTASFVMVALLALGCLLFFISRRNKSLFATSAVSSTPSSTWSRSAGTVPANIPTYGFPEWSPQRINVETVPSQSIYQQNNAIPAETAPTWPQQSFIATPPANLPPQKDFLAQPPVPVAWQQEAQKDFPAQPPISVAWQQKAQKDFPAQPSIPVAWQQESYRPANFPLSSPFEERRRPFSAPTAPSSSPFEEVQKSHQFSTPLVPSPTREIEQQEGETPTAKQAAIRKQRIVPDTN